MKKLLSILPILLSLGCYTPDQRPSEHAQPLDVNPIADLPSYEGGRVLHPWHFRKLPKDRFPAVATGNATDSQCFLADSYYRKCLILQCAADYSCATGTCVDAALAFDPDNSVQGEDASGGTYWESGGWRYYPLHLAVCVR